MVSLNFFGSRFTPPWWACVIAVLSITILSSLGAWQLHRANEKKDILQDIEQRSKQAPQAWSFGDSPPEAYQPLSVTGRYTGTNFFLDNQYYNHQLGYHILSLFELVDGHLVLIDRGWVPAASTRTELPEIKTPSKHVTLTGTTYYPSQKQWILGPWFEIKTPETTLIELIDIPRLNQFLHKSLNPFIIRMNKDMPYGYIREWVAVSMPPERHQGYAFQWFAMALVTLILFITLNIKKP